MGMLQRSGGERGVGGRLRHLRPRRAELGQEGGEPQGRAEDEARSRGGGEAPEGRGPPGGGRDLLLHMVRDTGHGVQRYLHKRVGRGGGEQLLSHEGGLLRGAGRPRGDSGRRDRVHAQAPRSAEGEDREGGGEARGGAHREVRIHGLGQDLGDSRPERGMAPFDSPWEALGGPQGSGRRGGAPSQPAHHMRGGPE